MLSQTGEFDTDSGLDGSSRQGGDEVEQVRVVVLRHTTSSHASDVQVWKMLTGDKVSMEMAMAPGMERKALGKRRQSVPYSQRRKEDLDSLADADPVLAFE